jgi:cysteinyl-tRNA synthetase
MGHHRVVAPTPAHPVPPSSGVVGAEGRYPLHETVASPLRIAGATLLPVGPLRMYTCGITPYDVTHVGHASTFVWADVVAALGHATGSEAVVARNVTDIDDVLTEVARAGGRSYDELALTQVFHFERAMKALSVVPPTVEPHARAHIGAVLRLAAALLDAGAAYETDGFVYFRGAAVPEAAGLDEAAALAASEAYGDQRGVPGREHPFDVAVWRPSPPDHPAWPSPWGWGRPGWHAECAAMALCALGTSVDVLLGGVDLTFPHHAYQQAIVEAATGVRPFARSVVHVGEVRRDGVKMAKSTGNLVLVSDLLTRHAGEVVRFGLLHRRWDEPWDCEESVFTAAAATLDALRSAAGRTSAGSAPVHLGVLGVLADELDVVRAVELALAEGGAAAAYLLRVLRLG